MYNTTGGQTNYDFKSISWDPYHDGTSDDVCQSLRVLSLWMSFVSSGPEQFCVLPFSESLSLWKTTTCELATYLLIYDENDKLT